MPVRSNMRVGVQDHHAGLVSRPDRAGVHRALAEEHGAAGRAAVALEEGRPLLRWVEGRVGRVDGKVPLMPASSHSISIQR